MTSALRLNTGAFMPIVGLGTHQICGYDLIHKVLDAALGAGYRSIDTARGYRNEEDIGKALKDLLPKYNLQRSDIFITSKLPPKDQGRSACREACLRSLRDLQFEYLDLFLIHWPGVQGLKHDDINNRFLRKESWLEMEQLQKEGKLKAIGVSNYIIAHLEELMEFCTVKPALLQNEHHPHLSGEEIVNYCRKNDIVFQAYSSLGSSRDCNKLWEEPCINEVAKIHDKSSAQILLRWAIQKNIGVLPRSSNPLHVKENFNVFDFQLSPEEMKKIDALDKNHHYCWDPRTIT